MPSSANFRKIAVSPLFIGFLALLQMTPLFDFNLIKPNLILSGLTALVVLEWPLAGLALSFGVMALIFGFLNYWLTEVFLIMSLLGAAVFFNRIFRGKTILNFLILLAFMTVGLSFLIAGLHYRNFNALNFNVLAQELILNIVFGFLFLKFLSYVKTSKS